MHDITVEGLRLPLRKGSELPQRVLDVLGKNVHVGRKLGGSPYTLDRIFDLIDKDTGDSSGLVIKLCWQPLGVPLGMSMRALQHEWVMFHNIKAFCQKHPDLHGCFLHAHAAIFVSSTPRLAPSAGTAVGASADAGTGSASPAGLSSSASNDSSNNVAAHNSGGDTQHRTIAAIILDKANGKTVKQRVKQKTWADARYLAQLLLQLPRAVAALEAELGFVHDDLRLDNVLEQWEQQQQPAGAPCAAGTCGAHGNAVQQQQQPPPLQQQQQQQQQLTFKLFDFGLSMVNPDRFSMGQQARARREEKKAALVHLQQQGYSFHKALGWVSLGHVMQFGRAADMYRLCKSLAKQLQGKTWTYADRPLMEACLELLAAVSYSSITARFADEHGPARQQPQQHSHQSEPHVCGPDGGSAAGSRNATAGNGSSLPVKMKLHVKIEPAAAPPAPGIATTASPNTTSSSSSDCKWLRQRQWARRWRRQARAITAQQLLQLPEYQQLAAAAGKHTAPTTDRLRAPLRR